MSIEPWLGDLLGIPLGGAYSEWYNTLGRCMVLLAGGWTWWLTRRAPGFRFLHWALLAWCMTVSAQVVDELLTDGANAPYRLYGLLVNLVTLAVFIGVGRAAGHRTSWGRR